MQGLCHRVVLQTKWGCMGESRLLKEAWIMQAFGF